MRILFIGDIAGSPGSGVVRTLLPGLRNEYDIDLVITNGENSAGGFGLTPETAQEIFRSGFEVITTGGHIWDKQEIFSYLEEESRLLRPLNYPSGVLAMGVNVSETLL